MQSIVQKPSWRKPQLNPVVNTDKHVKASGRYAVACTNDIVKSFSKFGYEVDTIKQSGWRKDENNGKQKHMILLRHESDIGLDKAEAFRIFLLNSHNLRTSLQIDVGLYRFICCNGVIASDTIHNPISIRHTAGALDKLEELIPQVAARASALRSWVESAKRVELSDFEEYQFARRVVALRLGGKMVKGFDYTKFKQPLREADASRDLWSIFNKYQEKALGGGLTYYIDAEKKLNNGQTFTYERQQTTQKLKDVGRAAQLNKKLSNLMQLTLENVA